MIYNGLDVDGALTRSLTVEMEEEKKYHKLVTCPPGSKWIDGNWKKSVSVRVSASGVQ